MEAEASKIKALDSNINLANQIKENIGGAAKTAEEILERLVGPTPETDKGKLENSAHCGKLGDLELAQLNSMAYLSELVNALNRIGNYI